MFSRWPVELPQAPDGWIQNPITGGRFKGALRPWWNYPDFEPEIGDIKCIWELSRLDWVISLAQLARLGDANALTTLNQALGSWMTGNPAFLGPNWKCGQEASLRVLQLAAAALILGQEREPTPALRSLLKTHLRRIAPTVGYALGQNNNHGTSEAAALFVGGSWLHAKGVDEASGWMRAGRRLLESTAARLIGEDGTFSQYSVNYHRVMLDSLCFTEIWRRRHSQPAMSDHWYRKLGLATRWLRALTDEGTGEAPNIGPNDGARLLVMTDSAYRDFRPSVQWAAVVFEGARAYDSGPWDDALHWLEVAVPEARLADPKSLLADDGGFAALRRGRGLAVLRYPRYRFRPTESDVLHVDLIHEGRPLLVDAGTYSYAAPLSEVDLFAGTAAHNTIQFGDRQQMPRLGRFLLGDWLRTGNQPSIFEGDQFQSVEASYRDSAARFHGRTIRLFSNQLEVDDIVDGQGLMPHMRWRLATPGWRAVDRGSGKEGRASFESAEGHVLSVECDQGPLRTELVPGLQSRHYLERTDVTTLVVSAPVSGAIRTVYRW